MRAVVSAFVLTSLLLAGCSAQEKHVAPEGAPAPTQTFTVVGDNRIAPTTTDTLHLLAKPRLTPLPPNTDELVRVPVESRSLDPSAEAPMPWSFRLPNDLSGFVATATFYVEVKGTLTGNPFSMTTGGCFWSLDALAGTERAGSCLTEDLQIEAGMYELVFEFVKEDLAWTAGTQVHLELVTFESGPRAPDASVELLTGAIGYDSRIRIYGIEQPLDAGALLLT